MGVIVKICLPLVKKCRLLTAVKKLDVNCQLWYYFMVLEAGQAGKSCSAGDGVTILSIPNCVI